MAYTVRKLLESEQFPKMKLLCGEKGLDLEVKGIRIIEIEDMERYLTGGEILITSFQVYLSCSDREVEQHFEDLVKSDISGFIVKKRKEYDPTGRRLSLLEKHCKKYEIPLVEIPGDFDYWGIIRHVMIQVFDKDTARLKYFKITHDSFNSFILKNNGSSNTASDIIKFLSIMIENPVVLYYGNLNCMVSTNSDNSKLILSDEIQPYKPNIITKFQYMKQMKGSCVQYVVKFAILSEVEVYITITEENRELTELDYMAIENAIINLQYGFLSEFAQDEVKKKYQRDIVHNILNGLLSSKEMTEAAAQLGMKESDTYRVVDFHTIKKNVQRKYTKEQLQEVGVIVGELMYLLPDALIYRNMDQIVMIQQVDSNQTELEYQKEMEEVEDVIQRSILYRKKDTDFQIGIGKSVEGYQRLKESYHEASRAIKYIDIIRLVTGDKNKSVVHYSNLGFFQIFGEIDDVTELERYIPETLKKSNISVSLIKANRTKITDSNVYGISYGYDVYAGGAGNDNDGDAKDGRSGGFVGFNDEGLLKNNNMYYCDVVRGTKDLVGPFSGKSELDTVYAFNSQEKVEGENNNYRIYRKLDQSLDQIEKNNSILNSSHEKDDASGWDIYTIGHMNPVKTFETLKNAVLVSKGDSVKADLNAYESSAKAVLMSDTKTTLNTGESDTPEPSESQDPCDENIKLTINKVWKDLNNFDHSRPNSITVTISRTWKDKAGNEKTETVPRYESYKIEGSSDKSKWQKVIKELPAYTTDGDEIYYYTYSITEAKVDGYTTTIDKSQDGFTFTITNRHFPGLPDTGGYGSYLIYLIAVLLFLVYFVMRYKKCKENKKAEKL